MSIQYLLNVEAVFAGCARNLPCGRDAKIDWKHSYFSSDEETGAALPCFAAYIAKMKHVVRESVLHFVANRQD